MNRTWLMGALLGIAFIMATGPAQAVAVLSNDNGWYGSDGTHGTTNKNIITGYDSDEGITYRNFFTFDLSAYAGMTANSATLLISSVGDYVTADNSETYSVYDYTGSIASLVGGTGGVAAYNDLGGGSLLGSTAVDTSGANFSAMPDVSVDLAAALADINALLAGASFDYALGGACTTCAVGGANQYIWGSSPTAVGQLILEFRATIPEPATVTLFGLGLAGLAALRRRRALA